MNPFFVPKTFAHIFNAPNKKIRLLITFGPAINEGVISETLFSTRAEAKAHAKAAGAQPHNY